MSRVKYRQSSTTLHLDARVDLLRVVLVLERGPGVALVADVGGVRHVGDLVEALDELQSKSLARVPANVAVHQPDARVVRLPGQDEVAAGREHGHVAADGVVQVQRHVGRRVGPRALRQDEEVVAVKVNPERSRYVSFSLNKFRCLFSQYLRVSDCERGLNDNVEPLVGRGEVDDGVVVLESVGAIQDLHEGGVGPVGEQRRGVECPLEESTIQSNGGILGNLELDVTDCLGDVWDQVIGLVITTVGAIVVAGSSGLRGSVADVRHYAENVIGVVIVRAGRLGNGAHPKLVRHISLVGSDEDVVALA